MRRTLARRTLAALAAVNVAVLLSAVGVAAAPHTKVKTARACVARSGALVLLSHGRCTGGSRPFTVDQPGPRGPRGLTGATGPGAVAIAIDTASGSKQQHVAIPGTGFTLASSCDIPQTAGYTHDELDIDGPSGQNFQVHGLVYVLYTGSSTGYSGFADTQHATDYPAGDNFIGESVNSSYSQNDYGAADGSASVVGTLTVLQNSTVFSVNISTYVSASRCQTVAQAIPSA